VHDVLEIDYVDDVRLTGDKPVALKAQMVVVSGHLIGPVPYLPKPRDYRLELEPVLQAPETGMLMGRIAKDLALLEQADRQFAEALRECREVERSGMGVSPGAIEQTQHLVWKIYLEKGDHPSAERACLELFRNFPGSAHTDDALMATANRAKERRDYPRAISLYTCLTQTAPPGASATGAAPRVRATSPSAPEAQYAIAECYQSVGRNSPSLHERALAEYRKCAKLYPASPFAPKALLRIADWYYQAQDYQRAIEVCDKMLRDYLDSDCVDAVLFRYGKCLVMLGDYSGARDRFQQILDEYPESQYVETAQRYLSPTQSTVWRISRAGVSSASKLPAESVGR
jgi:tetratricopeptide (TPR) repeat protein